METVLDKNKRLSKDLPLISSEEFELKVKQQMDSNWKIKRLCEDCGGWFNMPEHLIYDLFIRIGAKPLINKY